jgi:catechol 2,3-dioxygenase-like lactoylglutathione lyase family enzyme
MITNVSLQTVWVNDIDEAREFYIDKLGFVLNTDVTMGDFRWCTVNHPNQPDLELTLGVPGPPLDAEDAEIVARMLAKGSMSGGGLRTDDCRSTYDELKSKGVDFIQEPQDRPYGVEAVLRDNSGNWWVLVEPRENSPADLEGQSF